MATPPQVVTLMQAIMPMQKENTKHEKQPRE
jgi:hypothetical protein